MRLLYPGQEQEGKEEMEEAKDENSDNSTNSWAKKNNLEQFSTDLPLS